MANIKFSDFTVGNTEGDIDFVVGYKGASNIQISPTNLLASALGNYLPLAGGTMTGDVKFNDNVKARFGTGLDAYIQHDSSNTEIINATGNLNIKNSALDGDIIFYSDDGNGGVSEYFKLDGSRASGSYTYTTRPDGGVITFGDGLDLRLWHDPNTNKSYMRSYNNDLYIESITADKDILFRADDGSGGVQTYFYLDGGKVDGSNILGATVFPDKSKIYVGSSYDLEIFHNGVDDTWIDNINGNLNIRNQQNSGDIIFRCDNGNGGVAEYFSLDGGNVRLNAKVNLRIYDAKKLQLGNSGDLEIYHNNSTDNANIDNNTGDLYVSQYTNDGDIIFRSDDGSGGIAQYFRVDGGEVETRFLKSTLHFDNVKAKFGDGGDLEIYHDGSHSIIKADGTGNLILRQDTANADIVFKSDDGSGGSAEYFRVDGGDENVLFSKDVVMSINAGPTLNMNTNSAGNTSKILLHEGTTASPANGASIRYDGSANNFRIGVGTDVDTTRLTIDRGTGLATFANNVQVNGEITASTANATLNLLSGANGNSTINFADPDDNNVGQIIYRHNGNSMSFDTTDTERMRIDSSGSVLVGTTAAVSSSQGGAEFLAGESGGRRVLRLATTNTSVNDLIVFINGNGTVGTIRTDGSATSFNTSSDYRLKEDLKDFDGLDKVSKIPVYDFKWKVDDSRSYGVLAHELEEVIPNAVSGEKDADEMQGVDYSKVVPLLIKSIQELEARVKTLENK